MIGRYSRFIGEIFLVGDLLCLNLAVVLSHYYFEGSFHFEDRYSTLLILMNLFWAVLVNYIDTQRYSRVTNKFDSIQNITKEVIIHALLVFSFMFVSKSANQYSRVLISVAYVSFYFFVLMWHLSILIVLEHYRKRGYNYRKIIIIGNGYTAQQVYNYISTDISLGYRLEGVFTDNELVIDESKLLGSTHDCIQYLSENKVDEIYCTLRLTEVNRINDLVSFADNHMIRFKLVPDFRGISNRRLNLEFYENMPVLTIRKEPLESIRNRFIKRTFDLVFSSLVLMVLIPIVFPIVAFLIKCCSKGPVFFKQLRNGRNNEEFTVLKFRSMELNHDSDNLQAQKGDSRITPLGSFLRKTNLDELPQFINVFMGSMSIVGPRPHMLKHTQEYSHKVDKFLVRQFVKPGITGWAQVKGYRGATDDSSMKKRVQYDLWYIENWSLFLDIQIIFITIFNMLKGEDNAF